MKLIAAIVLGFTLCSSLALADPDPGWWSYFVTGQDQYGLGARGRDMIEFGGFLIVGGDFEHSFNGGPSAYDLRHIGRFNGASWGRIADGFNDRVYAVHVHGGDLYAGGDFTAAGLTQVGHVARWDGWSWNALQDPGRVTALGTFGNHLVAGVGNVNVVAEWDGETWSALGVPIGNAWIRSMAEYEGHLYAGGSIPFLDGAPVTHILRWDGNTWDDFGTVLTEDSPIFFGVYPVDVLFTEYDGSLLVGGSFSHVNGIYANGLARWDGSTWTGLGEGLGPLAAVSDMCVFNGDLVVVGSFTLPSGGLRIARWNGSSWLPFGAGITTASPYDADLSVQPFGGDLYVTGNFYEVGGKPSYFIARWRETGTSVPLLSGASGKAGLWISGSNPTSSGTDISFVLPSSSHVNLSIFDLGGRHVTTLLNGTRSPENGTAQWNGRNEAGAPVASGVYFVRLESGSSSATRKVVVRR